MNLPKKAESYRSGIQLLALLSVGFAVIFFDTLEYLYPEMETFLERTYFIIPCILFLCATLTQSLTAQAKRSFLLSAIAVLWFAAVQRHHQLDQMGTDSISLFAVVYLLAFPFAAVANDKTKSTGIKWLGEIYIAGALCLVLCAALLLLDMVPEILNSRIRWEGTRLNALWHPNIAACLFMIGIGCTLYFLVLTERRSEKILLFLLAAIQFFGLSLTHCRTAVILTCVLCGGAVFFLRFGRSRKNFLADAALALAVIVALFFFSQMLFDFHTEQMISQTAQQAVSQLEEVSTPNLDKTHPSVPAEASPSTPVESSPMVSTTNEAGTDAHNVSNSPQGSLIHDIWTLNNRTITWKAAFTAMRDNPAIRIWGTKNVRAEITYRSGLPVAHTHNSWIQAWMEVGTPGLLISLIYTVIALIRCAQILLGRKFAPDKKVIALMVLCIMAAGFLEPYLFIGGLSTVFANFIFFFLTGYLNFWCSEQRAGKTTKV